ncbi:hypothetical protein PRIPAC_86844 [Pristionchus pacificus]|uniref:Uncharacterized protein n=1 Tax=Pristionchus pacificus TaxID=54126 RepID=A0A2A6BUK6_PRIPA|nr:hypothetical protein PRIPAC_86844 [Pristionchus pacificus]|eukprot:PDM69548.1 hypothetical protein PRIPAC_44644 [Pristionchus pacificus]
MNAGMTPFKMFSKVLLLACIAAIVAGQIAPLTPEQIQAYANTVKILEDAAQNMRDHYNDHYEVPLPESTYNATRTFAQNLKNVVWVHGARPFPGMAESMADKVILKLAEEMANA